MIVQKIEELEQALADGTVQDMKNLITAHTDLKAALNYFMTELRDIYTPETDTWRAWCGTNLTAQEKTYIKNKYTSIKTLYDSMVD